MALLAGGAMFALYKVNNALLDGLREDLRAQSGAMTRQSEAMQSLGEDVREAVRRLEDAELRRRSG